MRRTILFVLLFGLAVPAFSASIPVPSADPGAVRVEDPAYPYETVPGDPMGVRMYTLGNGLRVHLSVMKDQPKISTMIAVRAGFRHEDQGQEAHVLEHLLFKGTDRFGTWDYEKEKPLLDRIEALYEKRLDAPDSEKETLFAEINRLSVEASRYTIPNEYPKMMSLIGATGTNASTSEDGTIYKNVIPSNRLESWLVIEAERFRNPVLRLFHTEMESIYEELNKQMDHPSYQAYQFFKRRLFLNHPYARDNVNVANVERMTPKKARAFFDKYYVPSNMAVFLAGDLDPDEAIRLVDATLGRLPARPAPEWAVPAVPAIQNPSEKRLFSPAADQVNIGFRFEPMRTNLESIAHIQLLDRMLEYDSGGFFTAYLLGGNTRVSSASTVYSPRYDFLVHRLGAHPKKGQSLKQVKTILLDLLKTIKKGEFSPGLLKGAVNAIRTDDEGILDNSYSRVEVMADAYVSGVDWSRAVGLTAAITAIDKQSLMRFVRRHYRDNYVAISEENLVQPKGRRFPKRSVSSLEGQPARESDFFREIVSRPVRDIPPLFLDYEKDIQKADLGGVPLYYRKNDSNGVFYLYYEFPIGFYSDKRARYAMLHFYNDALSGANDQKFQQLGCHLAWAGYDDHFYVYMNGLDENFEASVQLLRDIFAGWKANEEVWRNRVARIIQERRADYPVEDGMNNLLLYGPRYHLKTDMSSEELRHTKSEELVRFLKPHLIQPHHLLYYGSASFEEASRVLRAPHWEKKPGFMLGKTAEAFLSRRTRIYSTAHNTDRQVNRFQMVSMKEKGDAHWAAATVYNDYMGKAVYEEMRESSGLVYSALAHFDFPGRSGARFMFHAAFDTNRTHTWEGYERFRQLIDREPSEALFMSAKRDVLGRMKAQRIVKWDILMDYESALMRGDNHDFRKDVYVGIQALTFDDFKTFHREWIKDQEYNIGIMGELDKDDRARFAKIAPIRRMTGKELLGY